MPYQKVTMIEDLPELDQVDVNSQSVAQPGYPDGGKKLTRFIRHSNIDSIPPESGMQMYSQPYQGGGEDEGYGIPTGMDQTMRQHYRQKISEPYESGNSFTCHDMYNHVNGCHICQRFYKTDNTVYLIIIAILIVACALLSKKVLNV